MQEALGLYNELFQDGRNSTMAAKLGISSYDAAKDNELVGDLLDILQLTETDMTIFFRNLARLPARSDNEDGDEISEVLY